MVAWAASNTNKFASVRGIYVGTGGDVVLSNIDGSGDVTHKNVQSGAVLPASGANMIKTTSTASDFVLWY
jgi:hypothetical protein